MNVWFDISNSPQVNMFSDLIHNLRERHRVYVTCRDLSNTLQLLELTKIPHTTVGKHYGKSLINKVLGYPVRISQLSQFVKEKRIDVAVSQSSFHSAPASRLNGIPSIYMNDNEFAIGNIPSFFFATKILVPEFMGDEKLKAQFADRNKVIKYPGIKEGIYLWKIAPQITQERARRTANDRPEVYIRPEPAKAQYYKGAQHFLDDLIKGIKPHANVTIFPRDRDQYLHYKTLADSNVRVNSNVISIERIAVECDIFVGAGGTMTREMAVLGIPTVSVYQDSLLDVDKYLVAQGAMTHRPELTKAELMGMWNLRLTEVKENSLLEKGKASYDLLIEQIEASGSTNGEQNNGQY